MQAFVQRVADGWGRYAPGSRRSTTSSISARAAGWLIALSGYALSYLHFDQFRNPSA